MKWMLVGKMKCNIAIRKGTDQLQDKSQTCLFYSPPNVILMQIQLKCKKINQYKEKSDFLKNKISLVTE